MTRATRRRRSPRRTRGSRRSSCFVSAQPDQVESGGSGGVGGVAATSANWDHLRARARTRPTVPRGGHPTGISQRPDEHATRSATGLRRLPRARVRRECARMRAHEAAHDPRHVRRAAQVPRRAGDHAARRRPRGHVRPGRRHDRCEPPIPRSGALGAPRRPRRIARRAAPRDCRCSRHGATGSRRAVIALRASSSTSVGFGSAPTPTASPSTVCSSASRVGASTGTPSAAPRRSCGRRSTSTRARSRSRTASSCRSRRATGRSPWTRPSSPPVGDACPWRSDGTRTCASPAPPAASGCCASPRARTCCSTSAASRPARRPSSRTRRLPIATRTFDDLYALGRGHTFAYEGNDGAAIELRCGTGYPNAQVWVPKGRTFGALEPMTAPTNALEGNATPLVAPGDAFTARFTLAVTGPGSSA